MSLAHLSRLQRLTYFTYDATPFPAAFATLPALTFLKIDSVDEFPMRLGLGHLVELWLNKGNKLKCVPSELRTATRLQRLTYFGGDLEQGLQDDDLRLLRRCWLLHI